MTDHARTLFLRPLAFQDTVSSAILIPLIFFLFMNAAPGFRENLFEAAILAFITGIVGFVIGIVIKYLFVKPAIDIMDKESPTPQEVQAAARKVALLPLVESITVFMRWSVVGIILCITPFAIKGYITTNTALFGVNAMFMTALSITPFFYLAVENSLSYFFMNINLKSIMNTRTGLFNLSFNQKLLFTIFLIAIPPIGNLLGLIYQSIYSGVDMEGIQFAFFLIIVQTAVMTLLNSYLLMKSFKLSVGRMSYMLEDMAKGQGDLTRRLDVTCLSEVGKLAFWFNAFMDDIEVIVSHVRGSSLELHQSIEDVSAGSQDLSQATQEQAASVEEISASIEELNSTVQHNADLIREGHEASNAITKLIDQSKHVFASMIEATKEISNDSKKIGDIVSTVNEVAFHTNLLALNASVEAARAGEHGKGFAVVAGEVRSLAQRSAEAAREIKALIDGTVGRIKVGDEMMNKTSASLEGLVSQMEFFFKMMEVISTSSLEQTQNIGHLSRAISQIDGSTQHNASTVEELASTLENLRTVATVLAQDVQKFKTSQTMEFE